MQGTPFGTLESEERVVWSSHKILYFPQQTFIVQIEILIKNASRGVYHIP
jgi:hypothetical protein